MKTLLPLLLCLLLSTSSSAQVPEPFKLANLILVTYDKLSVDEAYKAAGRSLIDQGYTLDKTDATFQTIQANSRVFDTRLGKRSVAVVVNLSVKTVDDKRTEIKVTGRTTDPLETDISYRGSKGSFYMVSFNLLQDIARRLAKAGDGSITYAFQ